MSAWNAIERGFEGNVGSEKGVVRLDEEHPDGARITLEEGGITAPWSITCGVYGVMMHTAFFGSESAAREAFVAMKLRLESIIEASGSSGVSELMERFVADFEESCSRLRTPDVTLRIVQEVAHHIDVLEVVVATSWSGGASKLKIRAPGHANRIGECVAMMKTTKKRHGCEAIDRTCNVLFDSVCSLPLQLVGYEKHREPRTRGAVEPRFGGDGICNAGPRERNRASICACGLDSRQITM